MTIPTGWAILGAGLGMATLAGCAGAGSGANATEDEVRPEQPITVENFVVHPRIAEVRDVVKAVDGAIAAGTLKSEKKENLCEGIGEHSREKLTDAAGRVRKYIATAGSDHTFVTTTLYFSEQGKVRFVFETRSSIFGGEEEQLNTATEQRLYLNAAGEGFWQANREARWSGPNADGPAMTTIPFAEASELLELDPALESSAAQAFAAPALCN